MIPATRNDGLRLQLAAADVLSLRIVGAIAGVIVVAASARNGPGQGRLLNSTAGLAWQAPGSSTPGTPQVVSPDGLYMLEDGADPSKFVRVQVYNTYLSAAGDESVVNLADSFNNLGPADVTAANALAGQTVTTQYTLKNVTLLAINSVKLWLDATAGGEPELSVSSDGVNFFTPTSSGDAHVLSWASIAAAASVNVWVKRTIPAASASSPQILNVLQFSWNGF